MSSGTSSMDPGVMLCSSEAYATNTCAGGIGCPKQWPCCANCRVLLASEPSVMLLSILICCAL